MSVAAEQFPNRPRLAAAVALSVAWALAAATGQEVEGPNRFDPYRLCEFQAKGEPTWTYSWAFFPRGKIDYRESEFGLRATFVGPPGQYEAELLVTGPTGDEARPFFIRRVVKPFSIGPSAPAPVNPDGPASALGRYVVEQLAAAGAHKPTARMVGGNFGEAVKEAREGRYPTLQSLIYAVRDKNAAALNREGRLADWKPMLDRIAKRTGEIVQETDPISKLIDALVEVQDAMNWYADH